MARRTGTPPETFSIGFPQRSHDERPFASCVARHVGCRHTERVVGPDEAGEAMSAILGHLDEPFADPAIVPLLVLSRLTRERMKVALSGDGGDELFAGY